jgi:hypothetical protein
VDVGVNRSRTNTQKNSKFEPRLNTFVSALPIAQFTYLVFVWQ